MKLIELQIMPELDEKPNIDELIKVLKRMPTRKSPGSDGIYQLKS
jgi:hypothetical protein